MVSNDLPNISGQSEQALRLKAFRRPRGGRAVRRCSVEGCVIKEDDKP